PDQPRWRLWYSNVHQHAGSGDRRGMREDDVDEDVRWESGRAPIASRAGADRELARIDRVAACASAICLYHQLLHPQPEYIRADSARMAGSADGDMLPDPLGRAPWRHRLEQRLAGDDLHSYAGIRHRLPELRRSAKSVSGLSLGLRPAAD